MRRVITDGVGTGLKILLAVMALIAICLTGVVMRGASVPSNTSSAKPELKPLFLSSDSESIYAPNPADSWNRIFRLLFTRTVTTRFSDEFSEGAPFVSPVNNGMIRFRVSTRTFQRFESGDRSIDPLYPSFFHDGGVRKVLSEPDFSELKKALQEALSEKALRPALARALMQSDVWAAHDVLFARKFRPAKDLLLSQRREELLSLLARFMRKLALIPDEIRSLPENYVLASPGNNLPDLFAANGRWLEIQMSPHRLHDLSSDYRRAARVFLKAAESGVDKTKLVEVLRSGNFSPLIESVALITQNLLMDSNGIVLPTHLTTEVQVRNFIKDHTGKIVRSEIHQYELSRKSLLSNPTQGGLIEIADKAGAYFPVAGNDYQFASPQFTTQGIDYPVLVTLARRCEGCHGRGAVGIFSLSSHYQPPLSPITLLPAADNVHGWYVAGRKQEREDFKALWQLMMRP
jgi:hypothetical protein